MSRGLLIMALIVIAGLVVLSLTMGVALRGVAGVADAGNLRDRIFAGQGALFEPVPPLQVSVVLEAGPGGPWIWRIEGSLRAEAAGDRRVVERVLQRVVGLALAPGTGGRPPSGVLVVLHRPGAADDVRRFDASGSPVAVPPPTGPRPPL